MKRLLFFGFLFGLLLVATLGLWLLAFYPAAKNHLSEPVEITIERGSGGIKIAHQLAESKVITYPKIFRLYAEIKGISGKFQAGEYVFEPGINHAKVIEKLVTGDIILRQITLVEGKTSAEIVEIINRAEELTGEIKDIPAEGSLLPNTYRYTKGETRQSIIDRMQQARIKAIEELWPNRIEGLPFKTKKEAVILASIVEKETGVAHERTHVAGLYINRLHIGMLLQADPTVAYGVYGGQFADKPLRRSDLKRNTPYNSYLHAGLPPTPICNPGKEAIAAVLNPAKHEDLFMVATGTGGHYFAKTNAGHLKNVKKYRQWQRENGLR